jgi:hypothetical protein
MAGTLIVIIVILVCLGLAVYAVQYYAPVVPPFKNLIILLIFLLAIVLILAQVGVLGSNYMLVRP